MWMSTTLWTKFCGREKNVDFVDNSLYYMCGRNEPMEEYTKAKVETFQERFTQLCEESPKNDTALAYDLHVSKQTISAWKSGARSPKQPAILMISNYFNVDIAWLMGFDVKKFKSEGNGPTEKSQQPPADVLEAAKEAIPHTSEARIISGGIDKMPKERREQALKILQVAFAEYADYFKEDHDDET